MILEYPSSAEQFIVQFDFSFFDECIVMESQVFISERRGQGGGGMNAPTAWVLKPTACVLTPTAWVLTSMRLERRQPHACCALRCSGASAAGQH
jgi:hypothetical protein